MNRLLVQLLMQNVPPLEIKEHWDDIKVIASMMPDAIRSEVHYLSPESFKILWLLAVGSAHIFVQFDLVNKEITRYLNNKFQVGPLTDEAIADSLVWLGSAVGIMGEIQKN